MISSIEDAKEYVQTIKENKIKDLFGDTKSVDSLKIFAGEEDEENFKFLVDSMIKSIKNKEKWKFYHKEPLALIESFCQIMDHGDKVSYARFQAHRGIKTKRLSIGKTQRFFQKIYGNHFFK